MISFSDFFHIISIFFVFILFFLIWWVIEERRQTIFFTAGECGILLLISGSFLEVFDSRAIGFFLQFCGYSLTGISMGIMIIKKTSEAGSPSSGQTTAVSELQRALDEKTVQLEMAQIVLKNEMDVRLSFESDLQESEEKFRTIAEITPLGMILVDQNNQITYMNPQMFKIFGFTLDEIPDIPTIMQVWFPDPYNRELARKRWLELASSTEGKAEQTEPVLYQMFTKDGSPRTIEFYFAPYGQVKLILLKDITLRKKAEDALHESDRRYREMIEKIPLIAVILDHEGRVVFGNDYLLRLIGWNAHDILGVDWFHTFTLPEDNIRDIFLKSLQMEKLDTQYEYALLTKSQDIHSILWTTLLLWNADKIITGVVSLGIDITERKQREHAIQLANKKLNILSSISRHDISNGLTELYLTLEIAQDSAEDVQIQEFIGNSLETIRRIRHQIEFTRFYQDIGVNAPQWYLLDALIRQSVNDSSLSPVHFSIKTDMVSIYADPLIQTVFSNLIDNAIRHGEQVTLISFTLIFEESALIIKYADNGIGIPEEIKEKIFERGYGKHTGMGLFLIREILAITGIDIKEVGIYGAGAEFLISIPPGKWRTEHQV